jgi:branched-subunit amino acid ABC-type transport system permease component
MSAQLLAIQVFNGLVNGAFFALLSLGLAVIFGMLRIVNFAHGAFYMLGAFVAYALGQKFGLGFWPALIISPLAVGIFGMLIERTRLGAVIRASTENPAITRTFGIDVSMLVTLVFGFGSALAGLAGVLAAPIYSVDPLMGSELIITTFAVVVIGGLGSIFGSVITGFAVGVIAAIGAALYPPIANTLIFIVMALVLVLRPSGLFGISQ